MKERRVIVARAPRCLNEFCNRDARPGQNGYCSPCGQAVRRRIKQGKYSEEDLKERGKWLESAIDRWLKT